MSEPAHVLVVAHQTASTEKLLQAVAERTRLGPASFHLVVPRQAHGIHKVVDPQDAGDDEAQAALADLGQKHPGINERLFDKGQVRRFLNVYLNDEDIRYLDNLATPVKDGDELAIIPAVAGG